VLRTGVRSVGSVVRGRCEAGRARRGVPRVTSPHAHGAPNLPQGEVPAPTSPQGKQFVKFSFFRVGDVLRGSPEAVRVKHGRALVELLEASSERMLTRTYTTVGTRGDTDFMVWQVADDLHEIMDWTSSFLRSPLAAAIERPHSFLSMTMRSMYSNPLH